MARTKAYWGHRMPAPTGETWVSQEKRAQVIEDMLGNLTEALNQRGMDGDLYVGAYVRPGIQKLDRRAATVQLTKDHGECHVLDTVYAYSNLSSRLDSLTPGHEPTDPLTAIAGRVGRKADEDLKKILFDCGCREDP